MSTTLETKALPSLSPLEQLPAEIKSIIWRHFFAGHEVHVREKKKATRSTVPKAPPIFNIFLVSKACLTGLWETMFSQGTLRTTKFSNSHPWFDSGQRDLITSVHYEDEIRFRDKPNLVHFLDSLGGLKHVSLSGCASRIRCGTPIEKASKDPDLPYKSSSLCCCLPSEIMTLNVFCPNLPGRGQRWGPHPSGYLAKEWRRFLIKAASRGLVVHFTGLNIGFKQAEQSWEVSNRSILTGCLMAD